MEEAGYAHLLKLEATGALQKRHPFIYANASELRVGDVQPLLAAYKRIVSHSSHPVRIPNMCRNDACMSLSLQIASWTLQYVWILFHLLR